MADDKPFHHEPQPSYTKDELLLCGLGKILGPDGPRLPKPNMLMMDRITTITQGGGAFGNGEMIAELDIQPDLWFFECHFTEDPVMPGCLGLDAMWQMVGFYLGWLGLKGKGRALGVGEVKFRGQILPTSKIVRYQIDIRRIVRGKLNMAVADGGTFVDGRQVYWANNLRVGLFESTDDF